MKRVKILPILLSFILLSGCWDKVEIDRDVFIAVVGIDVGKDIKKQEELKKISPVEPFGERKIERLEVIYGFPDISEYTAQKGALPENKFLKIESYSLEDAESNATAKSSRNIDISHANLLAISNDVFKYPEVIKEIIDYITRQPRANRMMNVVIVDGRVEDLLKSKTTMEKNIQNYIEGVMESSGRNATILPITLNEFLILLSQNGNAILPNFKLDKSKNEVFVTGVSIIKNYEIKGSLTPQQTSILEMVRGKLKGGKKVIYENGHPIDLEIDGVEREIKVKYEEGKLVYNIDLEIEGRIKGYYIEENVLAESRLDEIEKNFSASMEDECLSVIKLTQKDINVDPFGLREYVEKFHPFLWDKIKDKWEAYYKEADVNVKIDTNIRRVGVIK